MKTKLFNSLKQEHSKLGLADEVLQAYADSLVATGLVTDDNLATISKGQETALKAFQKSIDKERTEKANHKKELDEYKAAHPENGGTQHKEPEDEPSWFAKYKKEQQDKIDALLQESDKSKAEKSKSERNNLITSKAKELQIPEWRQKEGFAISDEMDETAITAYMTSIKKNIVTAGLESENSALALSTTEEQAKELAKEWANNLPDK